MARLGARLVLLVVFAAALSGTTARGSINELWPAAAELYNAGRFAQAVVQLDRCLAAIEPGSDLYERIRQVRETAVDRLRGTTAPAEAQFDQIGALADPPAHSTDVPRLRVEQCDRGDDAEGGGAADARLGRSQDVWQELARECEAASSAPHASMIKKAGSCAAPVTAQPPPTHTRGVSPGNATLGVCAYAAVGTNAQLYDWVHAQLCAGVARLELYDDRTVSDDEREVSRWMLRPLLDDGRLVLAGPLADAEHATADCGTADGGHEPRGAAPSAEQPARAAHAGQCTSPGAEPEWAFAGGSSWALTPAARTCTRGEGRRSAFWQSCVQRSQRHSWVALLNAPNELLLPHRDRAASRAELRDPPADLGAVLEAFAHGACPAGSEYPTLVQEATGSDTAGAQAAGGGPDGATSTQPAFVVAALRIPLVELAEHGGSGLDAGSTAARAAHHRPPRPLLATHVHRSSSRAGCALAPVPAHTAALAGAAAVGGEGEGGAHLDVTCLRPADAVLVVRPKLHCASCSTAADAPPDAQRAVPLTLLLQPEGGQHAPAAIAAAASIRAVRLLTSELAASESSPPEFGRSRETVDWVGRWHQMACDARALLVEPTSHGSSNGGGALADAHGGLAAPLGAGEGEKAGGAELGPNPTADEAARTPWVADAVSRITAGDGLVVLGGALADTTTLSQVRAIFLGGLPEHRKVGVAQGFVQHMCQALEGKAAMAGFEGTCEPIHPSLMPLAFQQHALALAKALLGDDVILHNAGVSLVGDGAKSPGVHQDQPLPTGEETAWRGRVPPPSHPLSLQALWPLDPFEFENGPTFVLPRTHMRTERLDAWLQNGTDVAGPPGLFPVRFVTAEPGDVVFLLGSTWHGASSHARASVRTRGKPRLALLYEYAPHFVAPRDRYHPLLLARAVPPEFRALFPAIDVAGAGVAAGCGGGAGTFVTDPACADGGLDVVSVWEWPRLMRERAHCARPSTRVLLRAGRAAMPVFGLGTGSPDDEPQVIAQAIRAGYRLVDTGELYGNEAIVAAGLRLSGVHRESVFLSSKTGRWCPGWYATPRHTMARAVCIGGYEHTLAAVRGSLARLGQTYLDLYLLHWPMSAEAGTEPEPLPDGSRALRLDDPAHAETRVGAWRALLELRAQGVLRAIGVSNFSIRQLEQLRAATGELPDVLQMELHPLLQRAELRAYCEAHGILVQVRATHA